MKGKLKVSRLEEGTVIDHLAASSALKVLEMLSLPPSATVLVAINVSSGKMGRKDIVKVEGKFLTPSELDKVALLAPGATINLVKAGDVVEKRSVTVPEKVVGVLECPNPACVTNHEPVKSVFSLEGGEFMCAYCERSYPLDLLELK